MSKVSSQRSRHINLKIYLPEFVLTVEHFIKTEKVYFLVSVGLEIMHYILLIPHLQIINKSIPFALLSTSIGALYTYKLKIQHINKNN